MIGDENRWVHELFTCHVPVVPPLFVGRESELAIVRRTLLLNQSNLLVTGPPGIGKTSLLQTAAEGFGPSHLYVWIHMFQFLDRSIDDFLGVVVHYLCCEIWTKVLGGDYSDLFVDSLDDVAEKKISRAQKRRLRRIMRVVTSSRMTGSAESSKAVGAKLVATADIRESVSLSAERKPLETFEFLYLMEELGEVAGESGYNSIVVFCDEANHLPRDMNVHFFRQFLEAFASKQVAFAFVALQTDEIDTQPLESVFAHHIRLGPFPDLAPTRELLVRAAAVFADNAGYKLAIADDAVQRLHVVAKGNPLEIQRVGAVMFERVLERRVDTLTRSLVDECILDVRGEGNLTS